MQDHAKTRVHIWSLKSNTILSPRHPQRSCHCEKLPKYLSTKEIFGVLLRAPLFLGKWCGVATYFFFFIKKKGKTKNKIHD